MIVANHFVDAIDHKRADQERQPDGTARERSVTRYTRCRACHATTLILLRNSHDPTVRALLADLRTQRKLLLATQTLSGNGKRTRST